MDDRRDAVRGIKGLSKKYKAEVGSQCVDVLVSVITNDRMDAEIVSLAVESLLNVMERSSSDVETEDSKMCIQFSEEFLKNSENVTLLLNLLEDFDFQVRRPTVCLLTVLMLNKLTKMQEAILVSPMAISKVMDLLQDSREIIRNDTLLLLVQLTESNKQIQKIVAFENAFDRLLAIIREEGFSDGGIIVQDCITILHNLLVGNNSNQSFFREASLINQLVPFFQFKPVKSGSESAWSQQKAINIYQMLALVRTLVQPSNPQQSTSTCQKLMKQCGLLELLCSLMFAGGVPTEVLTETINTVAEVIRGCLENQQYFASVTTPSDPPRPAILAILMSMVTEKQILTLRLVALYCFQCFVYKNELGQTQIINTLLPSSSETSISSGQVLIAGLFGSDPLSNWCTAIALANSLHDSLKPQLLRVQLSMQGKGQVTLLQQITMFLSSRSDLKVQTRIGLCILLCTWLADCSIAVAQFLSEASNISFLIGQLEQSYSSETDQISRCLCATLLGICLAFHDSASSEYTTETLRQIITHRIGQDTFRQCLSHISSSEFYTQAAKVPHIRAISLDGVCFDHGFVTLFKRLSDVIIRSLDPQNVPSPSSNGTDAQNVSTSIDDHDSIVGQYKELIRDQDVELTSLRSKYAALQSAHVNDTKALQQQLLTIEALKNQLAEVSTLQGSVRSESGGSASVTEEVEQLKSEITSLQRVQESQRGELATKNVRIEQLQHELEGLRNSQMQSSATNADELVRLKEESAQLRAENEALLTERDAMDSQLRELQDKQTATNAIEPTVSSVQLTELQQQVKQLQMKCGDLQEKNTMAEKEQEDLLVLLADHDSKVNRYRSLLVENGIELPEDEESEDDGSEGGEEVD